MTDGYTDLGFARVDTDRRRRCGFPEVIFGIGKTPEQVAAIARVILKKEPVLLVSRSTPAQFEAVLAAFAEARWHESARCITVERPALPRLDGTVAVVCAGTSDLPVADEAAVTLDVFGCRVERSSDVGVAGIHRLLAVRDRAAERGRGPREQAGHRRPHEHRLRRQLRRHRGAARYAELLRQRRYGGEHRQRFRRGLRSGSDYQAARITLRLVAAP
jgi:hypothetical protein